MALFRVDFCGRGELADRQQKLAQMLSRLQKLSEGEQYQFFLSYLIYTVNCLPTTFFPCIKILHCIDNPPLSVKMLCNNDLK